MDYYFLIALLIVIFSVSRALKKSATWLAIVGCVVSVVIATVLIDISLRDAYNGAADDAATFGVLLQDYKLSFFPMLGKIYRVDGNIILLLITVSLGAALIAYVLFKLSSLNQVDSFDSIDGLMSLWWANILVFLAAPALVFAIAEFDGSNEKGLDVITSNLRPLLHYYRAPSTFLDIYLSPDAATTLHYRSDRSITLNTYARYAVPWLLLCILLTLIEWFIPHTRYSNPNLKEHIFGYQHPKDALKIATVLRLPWHGLYLWIYLLILLFLVGLAVLLKLLLYGVVVFFYGGFLLLIPMSILWVIYLIYGKK